MAKHRKMVLDDGDEILFDEQDGDILITHLDGGAFLLSPPEVTRFIEILKSLEA